MSANIPFLHELPIQDFRALFKSEMTWGELQSRYAPPPWCSAGDEAIDPLGCWGLVYGHVNEQGPKYCVSCDMNTASSHYWANRRAPQEKQA